MVAVLPVVDTQVDGLVVYVVVEFGQRWQRVDHAVFQRDLHALVPLGGLRAERALIHLQRLPGLEWDCMVVG